MLMGAKNYQILNFALLGFCGMALPKIFWVFGKLLFNADTFPKKYAAHAD